MSFHDENPTWCAIHSSYILEKGSVISYDSLWDSELIDDVVKHEKCCSLAIVKKCRHILSPFSEIIDYDDNITMSPGLGRPTLHEINTPFRKGVDDDNWMECS
jgi:hypothetical protein